MANLLVDAQNNLRNWANSYQTVRENDERLRATTRELSSEAENDQNGEVAPAGVLIENDHNNMNSSLDAGLLAILRTFDEHLEIDKTRNRNEYLTALFAQNSADEDDVQIKSRGTVFGAVAAGANTGDSVLLVCGTDENNDVIEGATIENITYRALGAAPSLAALGLEVWSTQGIGKASRSEFLAGGAGIRLGGVSAVGPGRSPSVDNASFDLPLNGAGNNKVQSWDIIAGAGNIALTTAANEIAEDRGEVHGALNITGDCIIRFDFRKRGKTLTYLLPFLAGLRRETVAFTGDLIIRIGSAGTPYTLTQVLAASTVAYDEATLDPDTADAWRKNFDTDGQPFFEIEIDNFVGGTIRIDDVFFTAMQLVAGRPSNIVSGTTPTLEGDTHTQECTLSTASGSVELTGGAGGSVDTIQVEGVEILGVAIPFNGTLAQTAQDCVDKINDHRTFPNYIANRTGDFINIVQEVPEENNTTVVSTSTTITTSDTDLSGASLGENQDSLVRRTGRYMPHAGAATAGWEDHA